MSLSCVEDLLREVANKMNEFLIRANNFERGFQAEEKVGRYIFTLALLDYLLNRCKAFSVTRGLDSISFNCDGRYLLIQTDSWESSRDDPYVGSKIKRNVFANTLFEYYTQITSKLPKDRWTNEESEFFNQLGKVNRITIGDTALPRPTEQLYVTWLMYRTPPIEVSVNEYRFREPTISIQPNFSSPEIEEVVFMADIVIPEPGEPIPLIVDYNAHLYPSTGEIRETTMNENEKYIQIGRQGACLVKDKLLDEFNRLLNLLDGAFSFALTYLLY